MVRKKQNILKYIVNQKINFIFNLFILLVFSLFFIKSFNYSFFWYEAFKAALVGDADPIFWDFEVYKCAADLFINNQNPYNLLTGCMPSEKPFTFNYPIITAFFYIPFTLINFFSSKIIWGLILLFSFAIYIIYQKKLFKSNINFFFYFIIILFCLDKTMIYSFFTGNMSFISQILISISFYFLLGRNKNIFFAIICIVSFFKFYFLIFLFCPILIYKFKYLKNIILSCFIVFLFYLFNYVYDPFLFTQWTSNVFQASIAKGTYDAFGIGSLNYIISTLNLLENKEIFILKNREYYEIIFAFLYVVLIISLGYLFFERNFIRKNEKITLALSIIIVGICIPRLEVYELIIFIAPIIYLLEVNYNFRNEKKILQILISFTFISFFLLNGDSGVTYPFLIIFLLSNCLKCSQTFKEKAR